MSRLPEQFISELRTKVPLADVASDYLDLKRSGTRYVGLCPAHSERTPSFTVHPDLERFRCYGCGAAGDIFDFIVLVDGITFREAVTAVAERAGIAVPVDDRPRSGPPLRAIRAALNDAHELFQHHLHDPAAAVAHRYLQERHFSGEHLTQWGIGFSPGNKTVTDELRNRGHTVSALIAAGLVKKSDSGDIYDVFRNRLMWPIHDHTGQLCAFAGRTFDSAVHGKYLNSPESELFRKRRILFGLWKARRHVLSTRSVIVVEGYTDVMAFAAAGHVNTVATCGTALTDVHVKLIESRIGDDGEIVCAFDNDEAGRKATWELFLQCQRFTSQINAIDYRDYGAKADGCDVRSTRGDDALTELVSARMPVLHMLIGFDCTVPANPSGEDIAKAARRVTTRLAEVHSPILRRTYLHEAARMLGISVDDLVAGAPPPKPAPAPLPAPTPVSDSDDNMLAAFLIINPSLQERIQDFTGATPDELFDETTRLIIEISHSGYPGGRPQPGDAEAKVWITYMEEVFDDDTQRARLWDIAYCQADDTLDLEVLAGRVLRRRLLATIEATQHIPDRAGDFINACRRLRALKETQTM